MPDFTKDSKKALQNENTFASVCMKALFCLFDNDWLNWEPESIWIELNHQGIDVPVGNRAQIMAGRSLLTTGRFWYDAHAFEATCLAFNNEESIFSGLDDAPVMAINWAVYEADLIHKAYENETLEYDREPIGYTAVQLYREGFVIAPPLLNMAESQLLGMLPKEAKELANTIREAWAAAPRGQALVDAAYPETPEGVQLVRLASVQVYFDERLKEYEKQIVPFKNC